MRVAYRAELEQLRLQVEVMAVLVDQNLERIRHIVSDGDEAVAARVISADDQIDAMVLSLTERCYDVLCREAPVASDLRLITSVIRVIGELERVDDLALRVAKLAPYYQLVKAHPGVHDALIALTEMAVEAFRQSLRAWSAADLGLAAEVVDHPPPVDLALDRLVRELLQLHGSDAVETAMRTLTAGRALERIADHARIIGSRLRYLLTGDSHHLVVEVR